MESERSPQTRPLGPGQDAAPERRSAEGHTPGAGPAGRGQRKGSPRAGGEGGRSRARPLRRRRHSTALGHEKPPVSTGLPSFVLHLGWVWRERERMQGQTTAEKSGGVSGMGACFCGVCPRPPGNCGPGSCLNYGETVIVTSGRYTRALSTCRVPGMVAGSTRSLESGSLIPNRAHPSGKSVSLPAKWSR